MVIHTLNYMTGELMSITEKYAVHGTKLIRRFGQIYKSEPAHPGTL